MSILKLKFKNFNFFQKHQLQPSGSQKVEIMRTSLINGIQAMDTIFKEFEQVSVLTFLTILFIIIKCIIFSY